MLLQYGADVNKTSEHGHTPLHNAAWKGHTDFAQVGTQVLLAAGADVNLVDTLGSTALNFAVSRGRSETAAVLRAHRAETPRAPPLM